MFTCVEFFLFVQDFLYFHWTGWRVPQNKQLIFYFPCLVCGCVPYLFLATEAWHLSQINSFLHGFCVALMIVVDWSANILCRMKWGAIIIPILSMGNWVTFIKTKLLRVRGWAFEVYPSLALCMFMTSQTFHLCFMVKQFPSFLSSVLSACQQQELSDK